MWYRPNWSCDFRYNLPETKELSGTNHVTCVYAYNTSVQESTRFSPFEVMFGRKPTMPIDIDMATNTPEDQLQMYLEAEELSQSQVEEMGAQQQ